ncbi:DUF5665 domain-containing protein [Maliponia aquimaris]|uniref:Uncharacterized protein n=1 Tax=Maliponia aquimaris TaxID=1673631 RepID=A0A238K7H6_9RHOB|nr:DUF5665 domain-containing protein [Maliponia aquimaris]SMX38394.1 hypothetical protein MAA8898_01572 [Maliponia aquimaris]
MPRDEDSDSLAQAVDRLSEQMKIWNRRNRFWRLAGVNLVRGLMLGLGTALGATALVSVAVLLLSQIEFIPILGELATSIIQEIDTLDTGQ